MSAVHAEAFVSGPLPHGSGYSLPCPAGLGLSRASRVSSFLQVGNDQTSPLRSGLHPDDVSALRQGALRGSARRIQRRKGAHAVAGQNWVVGRC